jgi:hypothetical protein
METISANEMWMAAGDGADRLDEIRETVVVEVALAVGGGVEVDPVDDALQERVFPGDGPRVGGDVFADLLDSQAAL